MLTNPTSCAYRRFSQVSSNAEPFRRPQVVLMVMISAMILSDARCVLAQTSGTPDPKMISAFFGLDDRVNGFQAFAITSPQANPWNIDDPSRPNPSGLTPVDLEGLDGLPVVFSELLDPTTLDPSDFLITTAGGANFTPVAATVNPSHDAGERRSVVLFGEFGDADSDPPVSVSLVGEILTVGGVDISQTALPVDVIPLADGPSLVYAETVEPDSVGSVEGSKLVLRAVWAGGIVGVDGSEVTEQIWSQYVLSGVDIDGKPIDLTPIAIADLNDSDNNHLLYFDQSITPEILFLPEGLVIDPNGDFNADTFITVVSAVPEPCSMLLMGLAGLGILGRRRLDSVV